MDAPASRVRFRIDGSVAAAAELLNRERLRDYAGSPIDPGTSRGNLTAYVTMSMPLKPDLPAGSAQYAMNLEVNNFSAERLVMGQKVEAAALARARRQSGLRAARRRQDQRHSGAARISSKSRDQADAEVRVAATLDEAGARAARLRSRRLCHRSGAGARSTAAFRSRAATAAIRSKPT